MGATVGSGPTHGKNQRPIITNGAECGMARLSLRHSTGQEGRVSVIAYGTTEVFRNAGERALERSASFCGLESSRGFPVDQLTSQMPRRFRRPDGHDGVRPGTYITCPSRLNETGTEVNPGACAHSMTWRFRSGFCSEVSGATG